MGGPKGDTDDEAEYAVPGRADEASPCQPGDLESRNIHIQNSARKLRNQFISGLLVGEGDHDRRLVSKLHRSPARSD